MDDSPFDRLGHQLDAAARRRAPALQPARHRRPRGRGTAVIIAALVMPALTGGAWAASSLLRSGDPVVPRDGAPVAGAGIGAVVPGSARLHTIGVADPDGGLPWGLRSFRTTRGLVCLQIGRVSEGKLGVLGQDGAFADDARFHELRPGVVEDERECFPPDGAGIAYLTFHHNRLPASGSFSGCDFPCRPKDARSVDYGLLGPRAARLTLPDGKHIAPLDDTGAYLIVQRPLPKVPLPAKYAHVVTRNDDFAQQDTGTLTPASRAIRAVDYATGERCLVKDATLISNGRRGSRGGCPDPPGLVLIPGARAADVHAHVTATAVGKKGIRVRFTARKAVAGRSSAYNVIVHPPRVATRCPHVITATDGKKRPYTPPNEFRCGGATGDGTDRDIAAGATVIKRIDLFRRPPGRYRITVSYRTQSPHPGPGGNLQSPGVTVGTTTLVIR